MPSSKFVEATRKIIRENPEIFEALQEFERTKKLPRVGRRERINLTIDHYLLRKFKKHCRERNVNMSRLIETHMKEELLKMS